MARRIGPWIVHYFDRQSGRSGPAEAEGSARQAGPEAERYEMTTPPEPVGSPYHSPKCRIGDRIECKRRGKVVIVGFSASPVRWPYAMSNYDRPSLIVCDDLIRAVQIEAATTVAQLFGVSLSTVAAWRRWLGVKKPTSKPKGTK